MARPDYRSKRDFSRTREPEPGRAALRGGRAIFVVQLHHASRRHYDFRLQVGNALKSWAVPKGPSYDPGVKRMAIEVEDHPVSYAAFEGEIPKGQYGGGHVARFDSGVWSTEGDPEEQLAKGHLRFELFGDKLRGGWHLVRSGKSARQPQWLLFKDEDAWAGRLEADDLLADVAEAPRDDRRRAGEGKVRKKGLATPPAQRRRKDWARKASALRGARKAAAPSGSFEPQLARLGKSPPRGEQWVHELKWDGYRILATLRDGKACLWSRNALDWTAKLPDIRVALESLGVESAALDGELVAGHGAREDFNLLQATLSGERQARLAYVLFDILHVDGVDVSGASLVERKALLRELLDGGPPQLAFSSHIEADGELALRLAGEQGFEGIISKRADRPYAGGRGDDWRKTKELASDEFAVVGFTAPKGSRTGFGSLLLARPDEKHGWRYAGRVGTGFTEARIREIVPLLADGGRKTPSVHVAETDTDLRSATWFEPRFVVEAFYRGIGGQGLLRQASFKGLRPDKDPGDLADSDRAPAERGRAGATRAAADRGSDMANIARADAASGVPTLSNPGRIIYPDIKATKQDAWDYYEAVMGHLLPEIVGRPLSVIRCPGGTGQSCFFQKHHTAGLDRVGSVRLQEESGELDDYLVVEDEAGLMELVQFNALEFHPWGSHARDPGRADRVVFDLDPGPGVSFAELKSAARDIRRRLEELELVSFLRVTGGKGLHVVVPLAPGCEWDLVKGFAKGFAEALAGSEPDRFVAVATKSRRSGRIFVDYLRNGRGATAVASYSLRARPGAPVAMPIAWDQLGKLARPDAFTMRDVPQMLRRRRKDPWEGIDEVTQDLSRWAHRD
jgi:bifunctional non-homologous end joining protein LigD